MTLSLGAPCDGAALTLHLRGCPRLRDMTQPLPLMRPLLMGWQKSKMPESAAVLASTDDCVFLWNVYLFSFMLVFDFSMHLLTSPNALEALPGASTMSLYLLDTPWCPGKRPCSQCNHAKCQLVGAFAVYSDFLKFLYSYSHERCLSFTFQYAKVRKKVKSEK